MSERTDRLIAVLVILVGLLLIEQVSTVPDNSLFQTLAFGFAITAIAIAFIELLDKYLS